VTRELALEPELGVHHAVVTDQDAVVQAPATREAHLFERRNVLEESERTRGRDLGTEGLGSAVAVDDVLATDGVRVVERVVDLEVFRRLEGDVFSLLGIADGDLAIDDLLDPSSCDDAAGFEGRRTSRPSRRESNRLHLDPQLVMPNAKAASSARPSSPTHVVKQRGGVARGADVGDERGDLDVRGNALETTRFRPAPDQDRPVRVC
jgi:hypothetical protein